MHGRCWANGREPLHSPSRNKENGRVMEMADTLDRTLSSGPRHSLPGRAPFSSKVHSPLCQFSQPTSPYSVFQETNCSKAKELTIGYSLPPIVHAFHGSKVGLGHQLQQWLSKGLQPLAVSLIGVDEAPPLWTHPTGCDFVRGSKIVAKPRVPQNRSLTKTQVLLLQSLWTPVEAPNSSNDHTPWPKACEPAIVFCGQHASL